MENEKKTGGQGRLAAPEETSAERAQEPADPGQESGSRAQELTDSCQESAGRAQEPADPGQESGSRAQEVTDSCQESAERAQEVTDSGQESAERAQEVTDSCQESAERAQEVTDSGQEDGGRAQGDAGRRRASALRISLCILLIILAAAYGAGYCYAGTHFLPGTRINGYDCAWMTEGEVEDIFSRAAGNYVLDVRFRDGDTETLSAQAMGFSYRPDGSLGALLQGQDRLLWPKYFLEETDYEVTPGGSVDEDKLTAALAALPELQEDRMEAPQNAYIRFQEGTGDQDGSFVIVPDTPGSVIHLEVLAAGVGDAASRYARLVDAEEIAGAYAQASVRADNAKIVARCKDLNDLVGASITYVQPDGDTIRLNADVMKDWLVKDKDGKLYKDEAAWDKKLWEFLDYLARNCNTLGMERRFHATLRGDIRVSGGDYGYMVNQITEHDRLVEDLAACRKETRKPDYYITPYNEEEENDGIGTSYIEVDLGAQHVWCYVDGKLAMESDCVSGNTTDGHDTPTGVFGIMFLKKNATLRGVMQKDGEYEYETEVGYWMPFYADCGFHDAWWRTAFGGTIYQGDGSHGCINLPVEAARELFSLCDEKMPVVVYQ